MIVQIYEIQTPQEAEKCIELGIDNIGSVLLSRDEWRVPLLKEVHRLTDSTDTKSVLLPLFMDDDTLYRALDYYRPDHVHFCESLTDHDGGEIDLEGFFRYQKKLKEYFPEIDIIRSIPVCEKGKSPGFSTLKIARTLEPVSDYFLTDTWVEKEPVTGYIGITGKTVDWEIARELVVQSDIPVILAGGLSPENVYDALLKTLPAGADSCTQTNFVGEPGKPVRFKKDFKKVEKFMIEARRAGQATRTLI